jgi:hypothetical protein
MEVEPDWAASVNTDPIRISVKGVEVLPIMVKTIEVQGHPTK